jgi:hypothetical protein
VQFSLRRIVAQLRAVSLERLTYEFEEAAQFSLRRIVAQLRAVSLERLTYEFGIFQRAEVVRWRNSATWLWLRRVSGTKGS